MLSPFITDIFNASIPTGHFPTAWKTAVIKPLIRKAGLDKSLPANYHPVSNLPFLSEILERVVHKQVTTYLSKANLLAPFQSAYKLRHSTETAAMKVFFDVIDTLDAGNIALLALLDLTAAFDTVDHNILTVDHNILLQSLRHSFGIDATVLRWFDSNVTGGNQAFHLSGTTTLPRPLVCGVPQGSVLGPLLFVLYTVDISSIIAVVMDCFNIVMLMTFRSTFTVVHNNVQL